MATVKLLVLDEVKGAHRIVEHGDLVVDADGEPVDFSQTLDEVLLLGNDAGAKKIINLAAPTLNQDAATKLYVDSITLNTVLTVGNDAGAQSITNINGLSSTGTLTLDAATELALKIATTPVLQVAASAITASQPLLVTEGTLSVGQDDTVIGVITAFGNAGSDGGKLKLYNGATSDGTTEYWEIRATEFALRILTSAGEIGFPVIDFGVSGTNYQVEYAGVATFIFINANATAAAGCMLRLSCANGNSDVFVHLDASSDWAFGVDNSDSDKFKIHTAATLAAVSVFEIDSLGQVKLNLSINSSVCGLCMENTDVNGAAGVYVQLTTYGDGDITLNFAKYFGTSWVVGADASDSHKFKIHDQANLADSSKFEIDTSGNTLLANAANANVVAGYQAALALDATDGFLYIPTCAGVPTGVPTSYTGKVALVFDTLNADLYVYSDGWFQFIEDSGSSSGP